MDLWRALQAMFSHLTGVRWQFVALALPVQVLELGAGGRAWQILVRGFHRQASVRYLPMFSCYLGGVGASVLLPARGGDAVRLLLARRSIRGSRYGPLTFTVIVESAIDLIFISLLLVAALWLGIGPLERQLPRWPVSGRFALAFVAAGLLVTAGVLVILRGSRSRPPALRVHRLRDASMLVARERRLLAGVVGWHALGWALRLTVVYSLLLAFAIPATARTVLMVVATQMISGLVPFAPGGAGVQQPLLVVALAGSAPPAATLAFGVGSQAITTIVDATLGASAICLMLRTLRWRHEISRTVEGRAARHR